MNDTDVSVYGMKLPTGFQLIGAVVSIMVYPDPTIFVLFSFDEMGGGDGE